MSPHKFSDEWGYFTAMPELVIERTAELGSDAVMLFLYFRYRTNKQRGCAFPTYETMVADLGWGRRRIKVAMDVLEEKGLLVKRKRFQQSTEYYLVRPPDPPDMAVSEPASSTAEILAPQESRPGTTASSTARLPTVPPTQGDLESLTHTESTETDMRPKQNDVRKRLELHFRAQTSLQPPKRKAEAGELWWSPLREIAELAGWNAEAAAAVIDECLKRARDRFQVSSPKSILKTARAVIAEEQAGNGAGYSAAEDVREFNRRNAAQREKIRGQLADAQRRTDS